VRLILASASPRRAELLHAAGYEFDVVVGDVDESIRDGETPALYVRRLAADKSAAAIRLIVPATRSSDGPAKAGHYRDDDGPPNSGHYEAIGSDADVIVIGADTTVVVDGEILAKPRDDADAAAMMRRIAGRVHEVLTGVSLRRGGFELGRVETTRVQVAPLSDEEIAWYVATGEGRDKAGAYAIQGFASRFIPRIEGSYSNVVGLPVACVRELLTEISGTPRDRSSRRR
jgi:nucleoside triphosphate pyrophosphatase